MSGEKEKTAASASVPPPPASSTSSSSASLPHHLSSTASSLPPSVEFSKGINGLDRVILRESRGSSAEVYLYGGHVTSWKNDHGEELLFLSSKATFKPPKAIRGGIPICFPQFGSHGTLDQHGFARNRFWAVDMDPPPFPTNTLNKAFVDLILKPSEEDMKIWPHSFEFRLRVALGPGGDLMLTSRIRNTNSDGKPFSFTFAYHTYFSVSDISEVRVEGLETLDYLDNLQNKERFTEQGDALTFESEGWPVPRTGLVSARLPIPYLTIGLTLPIEKEQLGVSASHLLGSGVGRYTQFYPHERRAVCKI